jgi:TonB family protein
MAQRPIQLSRLEKTLARLRKQEQNLWGRIQQASNAWLSRLERNALVRSYASLFRKKNGTSPYLSEPVIDLDSLLILSLIFHLILFFLLTRLSISPALVSPEAPVVVRILDLGKPAPETRKETPKQAPAKKKAPSPTPVRPPPQPKDAPVQAKEPPIVNPAPKPIPEPAPVPALPRPKTLAQAPRENTAAVAPQSAESLIQLPTRQSESRGSPPVARAESVPAIPGVGDPGASVPERLRRGDAREVGTTGAKGNLPALTSPDFGPYLEMIKKRVQAVWKYPDGISGVHQVNIIFVLDRAGKLVRAEVADSTDPRLASGAIQAMRTASPFPPIPESLRELTGWPLRMRFNVEFGIKTHR